MCGGFFNLNNPKLIEEIVVPLYSLIYIFNGKKKNLIQFSFFIKNFSRKKFAGFLMLLSI